MGKVVYCYGMDDKCGENTGADEFIRNQLEEKGIQEKLNGYNYLTNAIKMIICNMDLLKCITKDVYPAVAAVFHTKPSCVESSIRHAIYKAWDDRNAGIISEPEAKYMVKPTNKQFIAGIVLSYKNSSNKG